MQTEALRSWAYLSQENKTLEGNLAALSPYRNLIRDDPYLCFCVSQAEWRQAISDEKDKTPPADLPKRLREELSRVLPQADANLKPSIVLLMAQITAMSADAGPKPALDLLTQSQPGLKADAPAMAQLVELKMQLLLNLGLTSEAETLANQLGPEKLPPAAAMQLARLLAARYGEVRDSVDARTEMRGRIVRLVNRALNASERERDISPVCDRSGGSADPGPSVC